jgi:hypothetical protein
MGQSRDAYTILVEKLDRRKLKLRGETILKWMLKTLNW